MSIFFIYFNINTGKAARRESCDSVRERDKFHAQKYKKNCESHRIRILERLMSYLEMVPDSGKLSSIRLVGARGPLG